MLSCPIIPSRRCIYIYQNAGHIEKDIIEQIAKSTSTQAIQYHIKFKDNRVVVSGVDNIRSPEQDTDILNDAKDFLGQSNFFTEEELRHLQYSLPLTSVEKEWIQVHDKYRHISFQHIDRLVKITCSQTNIGN